MFITPFGQFRYKRVPQGFFSFGNGYNCQFDVTFVDFDQKERIVDGIIFYEFDLEQDWCFCCLLCYVMRYVYFILILAWI